MTEISVESTISSLLTLTDELNELLVREKAALIARDVPLLAELTEHKLLVCNQLDDATAALGDVPLGERIAGLAAPERERLEPLHRTLLERAAETQECNLVNGKIVHRSQQSVRELIQLMSGTDTETTYGDRGQTQATGRGSAIAEA